MKKLISIFAAVALVGSLAAAPRRPAPKAPAKPVVTAPVVTAPTAPAVVAAGKALGLSFGLSVGYVTDMFKQGDNLKRWAGLAGGGGLSTTEANKSGSTNCTAGAAATCTASGEGSNVSLNGLDIGLKVQFDILPWLFVRSGANYVLGFKNTYTLSATSSVAATSSTLTNGVTFTATGSILEIPALLGFNLIHSDKGTIYFAAGINYSIAQYDTTLSATQSVTGTTFGTTAQTFAGVDNTTKQSGIGIMWLIGGKAKVTDSVSLFGDIKFLSAAAAKSGAVTGTNYSTVTAGTSGGYATSNALYTAATAAASVDGGKMINGASATTFSAAGTQTGTGGLDLSYTRWQVGVQYDL